MLEFAYEFSETPGMSSKGERFGKYVRQWREETLRWTQLEVHQAGGPSNSTQTQIEKGEMERLTNATAKKIDRGLQWVEGSAWRVWEGGEAVRVARPQLSPRTLAELASLSADAQQELTTFLEREALRGGSEVEEA